LLRYETEEKVEEALKKYQGSKLNDRVLLLDRAGVFSTGAKSKAVKASIETKTIKKESIKVESKSSDED